MGFDVNLRAAIFDMDGTLLDTMPYWRCTTLEYLLAHQWPVKPWVLEKMMATSSRSRVSLRRIFSASSLRSAA